jgi:type IV fimbrial biogenesis protein FimT
MKNQSGMNLFELVVVMTIVGILAAIGVPSFQYVTSSNRVSSEANSLLADMQYARNEAVKEGLPVTICPIGTPLPTPPTLPSCVGTNSWQTGWMVFSDPTSAQQLPTTNPVVLRIQPAFSGSDTLVASGATQAVVFNREGFATSGPVGNVAPANVTFTLHDATSNSQWTRCLILNGNSAVKAGMLGVVRAGAAGTGCA